MIIYFIKLPTKIFINITMIYFNFMNYDDISYAMRLPKLILIC